MRYTPAERILLAVGAAATAIVGALTVLAWHHYRDSRPAAASPLPLQLPRAHVAAAEAPLTTPQLAPPIRETRRPSNAAHAPRRRTSLLLSAARGDSWLEIHAGSETGETLYVGTLTAGKSLEFTRRALWVRAGAANNLDATLNGRRVELPGGTATMVARGRRLTTVSLG